MNEADGEYRRMACHKGVFSPTIFNIYTNDQPVHDGTRSFSYADDLCIIACSLLLNRHWVNSQSITETTVCVLIMTRRGESATEQRGKEIIENA